MAGGHFSSRSILASFSSPSNCHGQSTRSRWPWRGKPEQSLGPFARAKHYPPLKGTGAPWRNDSGQDWGKKRPRKPQNISLSQKAQKCSKNKGKQDSERVTDRKARGLQMEEIACKCQTFFSLLSGRRKQTSNIFFLLYTNLKRGFS